MLDLPQVPALREDDMEDDVYLKNKHREIKKWYNEQADLQAKWGWCEMMTRRYGRFPLFWQDVREWEPWKAVESAYSKQETEASKAKEVEKRKSRWADASSRLKRSRWDQERRYIQPGIVFGEGMRRRVERGDSVWSDQFGASAGDPAARTCARTHGTDEPRGGGGGAHIEGSQPISLAASRVRRLGQSHEHESDADAARNRHGTK